MKTYTRGQGEYSFNQVIGANGKPMEHRVEIIDPEGQPVCEIGNRYKQLYTYNQLLLRGIPVFDAKKLSMKIAVK